MTCYIIDDEQSGINVLKGHIERDGSLALQGDNVDPLAAIAHFRQYEVPDVLFLDIDMPEMSGLKLAELFPESYIIFCTAYRDYAAEAYDIAAFDYLLKPIHYERFVKCMTKLKAWKINAGNSFMVHAGSRGNLVKVDPENICYIKGLLNYIEIYHKDEKLITHMSMDEVLNKLPEKDFSRVHRSFIINHHFIGKILTGKIALENGTEIPLGKVFRKRFLDKLAIR